MRKVPLVEGEYYHVFNRGVDKRPIFLDEEDFQRFLKSMNEFNVIEPIGSIYENSFFKEKDTVKKDKPLVTFVVYCLNSNHYHFLVKQCSEKGIEKFMHRLGLGYTKYFNQKLKRNGSLFQGTFKAVHIDSNEQLLYISAYVNLNNRVHRLGNLVSKSSWEEYLDVEKKHLCDTDIILEQYPDIAQYKRFAEETVETIKDRRDSDSLPFEEGE